MRSIKSNSSFVILRRFRELDVSIFKDTVSEWYLHLERVSLFDGIFRTHLGEFFYIQVEREKLSGDAEWLYKFGLVLHHLKVKIIYN